MDKKIEPALYILMRTDLASMTPGRAVAQGSHAANKFTYTMDAQGRSTCRPYQMWLDAAGGQGFGTVIVLDGGSMADIEKTIDALDNAGIMYADIVTDPTYPVKDGEFVHYVNINTCAYVFCPDRNNREHLDEFIGHLPLY